VSELRRRNAHGIDDVPDAMSEEILGFLESRDGDAARRVAQRPAHDIDRLRSLHVGTQHATEPADVRAHALEVAIQLAAIEHERGRFEFGQLHEALAYNCRRMV
jgi:hypothetical protein